MSQPTIRAFYEEPTGSVAYVASCPQTKKAVVIDAVWNFETASARTFTDSADEMLAYIRRENLDVQWILDTHPHADHLMAADYLRRALGAPTAIGEHVREVQSLWKDIYALPADFPTDGSQWNRLLSHGEVLNIGDLNLEVIHSPGHTLASVTYRIGDAAFVHDTLFQPDFGTARCDFPGGDASQLYRTIQTLLELPSSTRLFTGHDYRPGGRPPAWESTVAEQRASNVHLRDNPSESEFVAMRDARDAELSLPDNILMALQVNIRGGRLPEPEANGTSYLRIPVDRL